MKKQNFILILTFIFSFGVYPQTSNGQLIELTKYIDEIKVPEIEYGTIYIETEIEKFQGKENGIPYETRVRKDGHFTLDISKLNGDFLTIYFSCDDYAHIVLKNIPKKSLAELTKILPAIKNIWKPTCGSDCFTVDKKRTYKKKNITITYGTKKIVFQRKIMEPTIDPERGKIIPIPFMDTWPPDKIYWYEYNYK